MDLNHNFTAACIAAPVADTRTLKLTRRIELATLHGLSETAFMYAEVLRVGAGQQLDYINGLKSMADVEFRRLTQADQTAWALAIRNVDREV